MLKKIVLAMSIVASLFGYSDAGMNQKLAEQGEVLDGVKVLGSVEVGNGLHYVFAGNEEKHSFISLLVDENMTFAYTIAGGAKLSEDGTKIESKINEVMMPIKMNIFKGVLRRLAQDGVFYFNTKAGDFDDAEVHIVDMQCPGCREDIKNLAESMKKEKKKLVVIPIKYLGDDSAFMGAALIQKKTKIGNDFSKFAEAFLSVDTGVSEKTESIEKNTKDLVATGMITSVPFAVKLK